MTLGMILRIVFISAHEMSLKDILAFQNGLPTRCRTSSCMRANATVTHRGVTKKKDENRALK